MTHTSTAARRALIAIAVASCAYNAAVIARLSFVVDGVRYFVLADDQMISMRYAENLAGGLGLVWNPGDPPLEGYSNFLWVVYMAVVHRLGFERPAISVIVQITGAVALAANLFVVKRIAEIVTGRSEFAVAAVAFSAFYLPLAYWALLGTEVSVLTLVVTAAAWMSVRSVTYDKPPSFALPLLLGVSTLIRLDMAVVAVATLGTLGVIGSHRVRMRVIAGLAIVAAFLLAQTMARVAYFGDPLPNTYYLKLTGFPLLPRLTRGLLVTGRFLIQSGPLLLPIVLGGILIRPRREMVPLVAVVAIQLAYNIWIGGDAWEWLGGSNRFIAIVMPLFFVLAAAGLERASSPSRGLSDVTGRPTLSGAGALVVAALMIVSANYLAVASSGAPLRKIMLIDRPSEGDINEQRVRHALDLRDITDQRAVVAVTTAGIVPYFAERRAIDLLGKMDGHIARQPMHVPEGAARWTGFLPGHLKWDYEYSVGQLEPDVIQGRENDVAEQAPDFVMREYVKTERWYLRRDSTHIRWDQIEKDATGFDR